MDVVAPALLLLGCRREPAGRLRVARLGGVAGVDGAEIVTLFVSPVCGIRETVARLL